MEKPHQEYRDELADKLRESRSLGVEGKELAKKLLETENKTIRYSEARNIHMETVKQNQDILQKEKASSLEKEINLLKIKKEIESFIENIPELSFEWGPDLGPILWNDAKRKISELNKTLKDGEKPWRLPTVKEWIEFWKPLMDAKYKKVSEDGQRAISEIIRKNNGFKYGNPYWSDSQVPQNPDRASSIINFVDVYVFDMSTGEQVVADASGHDGRIFPVSARCVRSMAK